MGPKGEGTNDGGPLGAWCLPISQSFTLLLSGLLVNLNTMLSFMSLGFLCIPLGLLFPHRSDILSFTQLTCSGVSSPSSHYGYSELCLILVSLFLFYPSLWLRCSCLLNIGIVEAIRRNMDVEENKTSRPYRTCAGKVPAQGPHSTPQLICQCLQKRIIGTVV